MGSKPEAKYPSYSQLIQGILNAASGPIPIEEMIAELLQAHPSTAKNPHTAMLAQIRQAEGWHLVYLDKEHVLPLRLAFKGARYRIRLSHVDIDQAALTIYRCFHDYVPLNFDAGKILLIDSQENPIPSQLSQVPRTITNFSGQKENTTEQAIILKEWFRSQKLYHKDHILVTVKDFEHGILQLEREPFGDQHPDLIAERNRTIADLFYDLLESSRDVIIYEHVAAPTVYARLPDKAGYPSDHWRVILNNDPRLFANGFQIQYADSEMEPLKSFFLQLSGQTLEAQVKENKYNKEQAQQVFRFRAQLKYKPSIWREVEILGKQDINQLDYALRRAFILDSDHLSGFWKMVPRGKGSSKRYREVDIATTHPFERGEGSDTRIAELELQVGDHLKYVYDFGDWIEHTLELKSITNSEKGVRYPREVARNEPHYEYCVECQKQGKETIATWICHTCSQEEGHEVLLCEKHIDDLDHEDHYTDEILY